MFYSDHLCSFRLFFRLTSIYKELTKKRTFSTSNFLLASPMLLRAMSTSFCPGKQFTQLFREWETAFATWKTPTKHTFSPITLQRPGEIRDVNLKFKSVPRHNREIHVPNLCHCLRHMPSNMFASQRNLCESGGTLAPCRKRAAEKQRDNRK